MSDPIFGRVFISYRRQETSGLAGRLYDRLAVRLGDDLDFMDVDTIALGVDFAEVITQAGSTCEVLLAVIGPRWLTAADKEGRRRPDGPGDIVRLGPRIAQLFDAGDVLVAQPGLESGGQGRGAHIRTGRCIAS